MYTLTEITSYGFLSNLNSISCADWSYCKRVRLIVVYHGIDYDIKGLSDGGFLPFDWSSDLKRWGVGYKYLA